MNDETRVIAFANEKGGVGKTTSSINVGAGLTKLGCKVLVVDMDSQMNATYGLGVEVKPGSLTTYDLIKNYKTVNPDQAIQKTNWDGLFIIPGHEDLAGLELELVAQMGREKRLKKSLGLLTEPFDFIIVDSPPSLSLLTVNVFAYVREVIIPCQTHPFSFEALGNIFDTLDAVKEEINGSIRITGIIPTFFDKRTRVNNKIKDKLTTEPRYKDLILSTPIRVNTTIAESTDSRVPVVFYDDKSMGSRDYMELSEEIFNIPAPVKKQRIITLRNA